MLRKHRRHSFSLTAAAIIGVQMASAYAGACLMPPLFGLIANHITVSLFPFYLLVILILMIYTHEPLPSDFEGSYRGGFFAAIFKGRRNQFAE